MEQPVTTAPNLYGTSIHIGEERESPKSSASISGVFCTGHAHWEEEIKKLETKATNYGKAWAASAERVSLLQKELEKKDAVIKLLQCSLPQQEQRREVESRFFNQSMMENYHQTLEPLMSMVALQLQEIRRLQEIIAKK